MFGWLKKRFPPPEVRGTPAPVQRREFVSQNVVQLWAVRADNADAFFDFFAEDPGFWGLAAEVRTVTPLSPFIATQGQTWFDHDFIEYAYGEGPILTETDIPPISSQDKWGATFIEKIAARGLKEVNGVALLGADVREKDGRVDLQVPEPRDAQGKGVQAWYLGTVSFEHRFTL